MGSIILLNKKFIFIFQECYRVTILSSKYHSDYLYRVFVYSDITIGPLYIFERCQYLGLCVHVFLPTIEDTAE